MANKAWGEAKDEKSKTMPGKKDYTSKGEAPGADLREGAEIRGAEGTKMKDGRDAFVGTREHHEGKPEDDEAFWGRALEWLKGVPRALVERAMNAQTGGTPVPAPAETEEISEETKEQMELTEGAKGDKIAFDFEEERRRVAADNLKKEQEQEEAWKNSPATGGGL